MEIMAKLRYLRIAPRKVRAISDLICGLDVNSAEAQLIFLSKRAAKPVLKLLNSAVANALDKYLLKKEDLYIKKFFVEEGPTLYRWSPRAFGRAMPIRKRSSHLTLVLETKKEIIPKKKEREIKKEIVKPKEIEKEEISKIPEKKREERKKAKEDLRLKRRESFIKRIFRRKTI